MLYIKALHVEGCTILSSHRKYFATITFNYKMQISLWENKMDATKKGFSS